MNNPAVNIDEQESTVPHINSVPSVHMSTPPLVAQPPASHKSKKRLVLFVGFLVLAAVQISWLGSLATSAVSTLNSANLSFLLTSIALTILVSISTINLYRINGFDLKTRKEKFLVGVGALPVVSYYIYIALIFLAIQMKGYQWSMLFLSLAGLSSQLSLVPLLIAAIGMNGVVHKRHGIRRILHLWPVLLIFLGSMLTILIVGAPSGSHVGVAERAQLDQAKANMSSYLADKYGMEFIVKDARFMKEIRASRTTKVVTTTVSLARDPSFTYTANVYLHKNVDLSTGEMKDDPTYREDFIGAYWKSGFENVVCPAIRSLQRNFNITNCTTTDYDLDISYNEILAKYRGNIPTYAKLDEDVRKSINFSLTVESNDDKNIENVLQHVGVVEGIIGAIRNTQSTSTLTYFAHATNEAAPSLGYSATTDTSTPGGRRAVRTLMFEQDPSESKTIINDSRRFYNPQTGNFDLDKPVLELSS
jgi:hypothetical protein